MKNELLDNAQKHLRTGKRGRKRKGKKPKSTRAVFISSGFVCSCSVNLTLLSRTTQEFCWKLRPPVNKSHLQEVLLLLTPPQHLLQWCPHSVRDGPWRFSLCCGRPLEVATGSRRNPNQLHLSLTMKYGQQAQNQLFPGSSFVS